MDIKNKITTIVKRFLNIDWKSLWNSCVKNKSIIISILALIVSIISSYYSYTQNKLIKEQNLIASQQNEIAEKQIELLINEGNPIFKVNCLEKILDAVHNDSELYEELPKFEIMNFGKPCKDISIYLAPHITFYCDTTQISAAFNSPYRFEFVNENEIDCIPEKEEFWKDTFNAINEDIDKYEKEYGVRIRYEINYFLKIEYEDFYNKPGMKYWAKCNMGGIGNMYEGFISEELYKIYLHKYYSFEIHEQLWYKHEYLDLDDIIDLSQDSTLLKKYNFLHK